MRGHCSVFIYWGTCWPSLFKFSFISTPKKFIDWKCSSGFKGPGLCLFVSDLTWEVIVRFFTYWGNCWPSLFKFSLNTSKFINSNWIYRLKTLVWFQTTEQWHVKHLVHKLWKCFILIGWLVFTIFEQFMVNWWLCLATATIPVLNDFPRELYLRNIIPVLYLYICSMIYLP